jgi:hypothetical protein
MSKGEGDDAVLAGDSSYTNKPMLLRGTVDDPRRAMRRSRP